MCNLRMGYLESSVAIRSCELSCFRGWDDESSKRYNKTLTRSTFLRFFFHHRKKLISYPSLAFILVFPAQFFIRLYFARVMTRVSLRRTTPAGGIID